MKKILKTTVYNLIASAIVLGIWVLFNMPIYVALFLYITLYATMFIANVLYEYVTLKNIKTLFKRLWFLVKYKRVDKYYIKLSDYHTCIEQCPIKKLSIDGYEIMIGSVSCQECENCIEHNITEYGNNAWIKCSYLREKRSFNPLNWLKKLFAIIFICLFFSSCSVYVNCNFNKVPKYKTTQQDSTVLQINEYWF